MIDVWVAHNIFKLNLNDFSEYQEQYMVHLEPVI